MNIVFSERWPDGWDCEYKSREKNAGDWRGTFMIRNKDIIVKEKSREDEHLRKINKTKMNLFCKKKKKKKKQKTKTNKETKKRRKI